MNEKIKTLVSKVISGYVESPIDLLNINDQDGEQVYIKSMEGSYVRTITDIVSYFENKGVSDFSKIRILEIGAFLGVVSISLAKLGFRVVASDLPEFMENKSLQNKYKQNGVDIIGLNLSACSLPLESNDFDIVVMCETLEHLNFNPIPILQDMHRVLKNDGILYLTVPNMACLENRIGLLRGRSVHHPINYFFLQLDKKENMVAAIHWREYTRVEILEMLERLDFKIIKHYFTDDLNPNTKFARIRKILLNFMPQLRVTQIVLAQCHKTSSDEFIKK